MVRKQSNPWSELRDKNDPDRRKRADEHRREQERHDEQMIRGDVNPEQKK